MDVEGSWWLIGEGTEFNRETTPRLDLAGGIATWSDGPNGEYAEIDGKLWLKRTIEGNSPAELRNERLLITGVQDDGDYLAGRLYLVIGELAEHNASGRAADFTAFHMVRDGSETLDLIEAAAAAEPREVQPPEPDRLVADLDAPGALLRGSWVMLVEDEPFDRARNTVLDLDALKLSRLDGKLMLDVSARERIVFDRVSGDGNRVSGLVYRSADLAKGDPGALWDALDGAGPGDERFDQLPGCDPVMLYREEAADAMFTHSPSRYSVIDVSMYSTWRVRASGFYAAETDDELEAALRALPSATATLQSLAA